MNHTIQMTPPEPFPTLPACCHLLTYLPLSKQSTEVHLWTLTPQWKCHGATPDVNILPLFLSLSLSPTLFSSPLPPPVTPPPPIPSCSYEFSISFFGEKISNGGREKDISPTPTGECIWQSVHVRFIRAMKQSTQHKQCMEYIHTHTQTQRCARSHTRYFLLSFITHSWFLSHTLSCPFPCALPSLTLIFPRKT